MNNYAILLKTDGSATPVNLDGSLKAYQDAVGGFIETVQSHDGQHIIIMNEHGKLEHKPVNGLATSMAEIRSDDFIAGDVLIVKRGDEDFQLLNKFYAKWLASDLSNRCPFCGKKLNGQSNNSAPLCEPPCCDTCNSTIVVTARLIYSGLGGKFYD